MVLNEAAVLWAFDAPRWTGGDAAGTALMTDALIVTAAYRARDGAGKRILAFWHPVPRSAQADLCRELMWRRQ